MSERLSTDLHSVDFASEFPNAANSVCTKLNLQLRDPPEAQTACFEGSIVSTPHYFPNNKDDIQIEEFGIALIHIYIYVYIYI